MSLPVFFESPCRSRAAATAARLYQIKALLAVCVLTLLLALPSHAQWQVQRPDGTLIQSGNDGYPLYTTQSGTTTSSYPPAIPPKIDTTPVPLVYDEYHRVDMSRFVFNADNVGGNQYYPGFYRFSDSSVLPWNGAMTADISAHLEADWVWMGAGKAPDYLDLSVSTAGDAYASRATTTADSGSGATATSAVSDSLGDAVSASVDTSDTTIYHPFSNRHLIRVPVIGGKARAVVTGKLTGQATNTIAYGTYDPHGSTVTNGGASAYSSGYLSGNVYQAGPPKSILINRPENAGANIEADQKIFDFSTGEWTCYGDSRFSNDVYGSRYSTGGYSTLIGGSDFGWEDWTMSPVGSPWPSEDSMHTLSIPDPWSRNWHWYAENGSTSPPTSLGSDWGDTFYVSTFAPHVRPHKDWPYSSSPGFFDPVYIPHDLLEEIASSSVPGPETRRINLHLTDTVVPGVGNPEWEFDHSANFNITYHNQFELITQGTPHFVTSADIPWEMAKGPDGQPISQSAYNNPILGWGPQLQYYVEANWQVNINFVSWAGYSGGQTSGSGTTSTVGPTDIPPNSIGVVYQRPHKIRFPFTYRHYLAAGREIYGYDS